MEKEKNSKKELHREYLKRLLLTAQVFELFTKGKLERGNDKAIEEWNPEETAAYYTGSEKMLSEERKRVKENVFATLGIYNPDKQKKAPARILYLRRYAAVAAILVVVLLFGGYTFNRLSKPTNAVLASADSKSLLCRTGEGEIKQITLPDGTVIHINSNSSILYVKQEYNASKREIWIEDGEAFFEVVKNPEKPFIIHSGYLQTIVRGTSFNVKAYKGIKKNEISVRSGKVEVVCDNEKIGTLIANQQITYNTQNREYSQSEGRWQDATAWMDKRLVLKQANIDELKLRLKQLYGVDLAVENGILSENNFNASYPQGTQIENVLRNISEVYDVKYKFENQQKVIIYK